MAGRRGVRGEPQRRERAAATGEGGRKGWRGKSGFVFPIRKDIGDNRRDVILINPPLGSTEGRHIQQNFPVQANATELLLMQHIIKKLKKRTRWAAMVAPEGTLLRAGVFAEVKQDLLELFHLNWLRVLGTAERFAG